MRKIALQGVAFGVLAALVLSANAQPGERDERGGGKDAPRDRGPGGKDNPRDKGPGDKKGPPPFELGKVLPPFVRDQLRLTEEQEKQIQDLEKDVKEKLQKILTEDQQKRLKEMAKGFKGPKDGPPRDAPRKDRGTDLPRDREDRRLEVTPPPAVVPGLPIRRVDR